MQFSLINASLSGFSISAELLCFHQNLICGTHVLPQLRQFWATFRAKLDDESLYRVSINAMRLRLLELQKSDNEAQKIRAEKLKDDYEEIDRVLHYQGLLFVPEAIRTDLINRYHNDPLAGHFGVNKTRELVDRKYYWPRLRKDVESYVKECDVCLASKAVRHKPYEDLQSLPIPTHQ